MADCKHEWIDEYYGHRCKFCGQFIPFGCEPWIPTGDYISEDELNDEYSDDEWDDPFDEDEPCGNLYAHGTEQCDWCKWSDQCYQDYVYWLKREEKNRKVKKS